MLVFVLSNLEAGILSPPPPPPLGAAPLWTLAGLHYLGCGVSFKVCACVHVCSRRLCVYVQYSYIYWLV